MDPAVKPRDDGYSVIVREDKHSVIPRLDRGIQESSSAYHISPVNHTRSTSNG